MNIPRGSLTQDLSNGHQNVGLSPPGGAHELDQSLSGQRVEEH